MHPVKAGSGRGEAGFTLIDMLFVVALVGLLSTLAIPGLMRAKGAAQSSSALGTIRVINSAELSYAISCGLGFYSPDLPTLAIVPPGAKDAFIAPDLATGPSFVKSGYQFSLAGTAVAGSPASCNGLTVGQAAAGYAVVADSLDKSAGARFFGTNTEGVIYEHSASMASTMPETGAPVGGVPIK